MASMNLGTYSKESPISFPWSGAMAGAVSWSRQPDGQYASRSAMVRQLMAPGLFVERDISRGPEGARHVGGVHHALGR